MCSSGVQSLTDAISRRHTRQSEIAMSCGRSGAALPSPSAGQRCWAPSTLRVPNRRSITIRPGRAPDEFSTAFMRRALWESAVVSYGRIAASDRQRKLDHEDLLKAAGGEDALAFHEQVMRWSHDHVARRLSKEFEAVEVFAHHTNEAAERPALVGLRVSTWRGPKDDSPEWSGFANTSSACGTSSWPSTWLPTTRPGTRGSDGGGRKLRLGAR